MCLKLESLYVKKVGIDTSLFENQAVKTSDYNLLIEKSSIIKLEGNKPLVYLNLDDHEFDGLIPHLQKLKLNKSNRRNLGNKNFSILVGGVPARTNHSPSCGYGSLLDKDELLNNAIVNQLSSYFNEFFQTYLQQWHKVGMHFSDKLGIHPDYEMPGSPWTTAIINRNSEHHYHYDKSNSKNIFSAMVALKNQISGGYLVLPEYGIALKTANRSLTFFYGRNILHGVSPIQYSVPSGYRYSIVLYNVNELKKCDSIINEIKKAK